MNALSLDTSHSCITISALKDKNLISLTLDVGMRQSEKLLPSIDFVLKEAEIEPRNLDFTCLTLGPGTFTGLRLGFSALKAIELSYNVPIYGANTLDFIEWPYRNFCGVLISVIDAKKEMFYAKITKEKNVLLQAGDYTLEKIATLLNEVCETNHKGENLPRALVLGEDAELFVKKITPFLNGIKLEYTKPKTYTFSALFEIAQEQIQKGNPPLKDFDGPLYFRASEAEQNLTSS